MLTIFISATLPLLLLAAVLWRGRWKYNDLKTIWYLVLSIPASATIASLIYFFGTYSQSYFAEVWSYKITAVRHYEEWNERVPCRHAVYRTETRTRTVYDGSGKRGGGSHTETYTVQVFDHYMHPYDVDDHPEYWVKVDENQNESQSDQQEFSNWKATWSNVHFVNMHRDYHTIDGNMFECDWDKDFTHIYPWSEIHTYENRVRVSRSAFSFAPVDKATKDLWPRPADTGDLSVIHCHGVPADNNAEWMFRRLNADIGPKYKIHNILLLFDANLFGPNTVEVIKNAWQGPNKNELVTCIGIGADQKIVWCDCMSWMDDTTIHSMIRQEVYALGKYDSNRVLDILRDDIPKFWKKKSFHDFDYLSVSLPVGYSILSFVLVVGASMGAFIFCDLKVEAA